jgi:hypothetical protein
MTEGKHKAGRIDLKALVGGDQDFLRELIRAPAVETHENWLEQPRYLNLEELREHKRLSLRQAA